MCPENRRNVEEIYVILVTRSNRDDVEHRLRLALCRVAVSLKETCGELQLLSKPSNLRELLRRQETNEKKELEASVRQKHILYFNRTGVRRTNKHLWQHPLANDD